MLPGEAFGRLRAFLRRGIGDAPFGARFASSLFPVDRQDETDELGRRMALARSPFPRRWSVSNQNRCHPLVQTGGIELDQALLKLHAVQEMDEFWEGARQTLHAALPLHFICMCLRPFALMPSTVFRERAPFASEEEFQHFQEISPIQAYLSARPGKTLVRISDIVPQQELLHTDFYLLFMRPHNDRHFACLNFWEGTLFQGLIGLHRTSTQHDFTDAEMALLAQLHPHFNTVLHRILSLHRERAVRLSLEKLLVNLPIATVLLDWDLKVASRNRSAVEFCSIWKYGPERAAREKSGMELHLPEPVLRYCESFKAHWIPGNHRLCPLTTPAGVYFPHPDQPGLRASVNLLQLDAAPLSMPMFLIRFEATGRSQNPTGSERTVALSLLTRLSPRESDVARLVGQGSSNDEVAKRLGKSVLTVKRQLRSIYQKLNVTSRGRLTALMR
jgi:DNA-binding CsgD family transcriptional regulator